MWGVGKNISCCTIYPFSECTVHVLAVHIHFFKCFTNFQVECFAPYDDHRWVNIGKERNGNPADAVQYARALRPPYQLLSFLRIKGNCSKGMGCSNKNTMVSLRQLFSSFFCKILSRQSHKLWSR